MAIPPDTHILDTYALHCYATPAAGTSWLTDVYRLHWRVPTVEQFRREVSMLRSVSKAGKAWIVDERCRRAGIGRHKRKITRRPWGFSTQDWEGQKQRYTQEKADLWALHYSTVIKVETP